MSDFKAKMHQIRFRLGLHPIPRWGSLQRFPTDPLAGFREPTSKGEGKRGRGRKRRRWDGRERGGDGRGRRREEMGGEEKGGDMRGGVDPQGFAEMTPLLVT